MTEPAARTWKGDLIAALVGCLREVVLFSFGINVLALAVPIFVLQVYDRVVFHAGMSTLQGLVAGMTLALVFDLVLRQARARILQTLAVRVDVLLGRRLFETLTRLPLRTLERISAAEWTVCFRDIDTIRAAASGGPALLLCDMPFMVLAAALIYVIAAPIAWVLALVIPLLALLAWASGAAMHASGRRERDSVRRRDDLLVEAITARAAIKQLGCASPFAERWDHAHADAIVDAARRGGRSDTFTNLSVTVTTAATVLLTTAGALAILDQRMSIGALVAVNMLSGRLLGPLGQLIGSWRSLIGVRLALRRVGAMFAHAAPDQRHHGIAMTRPSGEIVLEKVAFAFAEGAPPAIADVSLRFPGSGLHLITGANGSGKSTLLRLIRGLYRPSSGRVLIAGADISQFGDDALARWIAYMPAGGRLISGSIRDNIVLGQPDAEDEAITRTAAQSGLDAVVATIPEGYAFAVGEAGRRLSAGQRQRVALARACLGDPAIMLLDEPAAHLDARATEHLATALRALSRNRPILVASHSPALLAAADTITRLDRGGVAMTGPGSDVLPLLLHGPARHTAHPVRRTAAGG